MEWFDEHKIDLHLQNSFISFLNRLKHVKFDHKKLKQLKTAQISYYLHDIMLRRW